MTIHKYLYEKDFYKWAMTNADLIREKKFDEIDIENIAEEIESMGNQDKRSIVSQLSVLLAHLLKWSMQPENINKSWSRTIINSRNEIEVLLEDSPSLKNILRLNFEKAYKRAVIIAADETSIFKEKFPKHCPFTLEECLDENFYPD